MLKEGAYAGVLLADSNPLQNISRLADPENDLQVVTQDGSIYRSALK